MRKLKRTALFSIVTAVAMIANTALPIYGEGEEASDENLRNVTLKLKPNWTKTIDYKDIYIAQYEYSTEYSEKGELYSSSIDFSDVDPEDPQNCYKDILHVYDNDFGFDMYEHLKNEEFREMVKDKHPDIPYDEFYPEFKVTDFTFSYEYVFKINGEEVSDHDCDLFVRASGNSGGEWVNVDFADISAAQTGSGNKRTIKLSELKPKNEDDPVIEDYGYFAVNAGTWCDDTTAELSLKIYDVKVDIAYSTRGSGDNKDFYDDETQSGQWLFDINADYRHNSSMDMILAAIKEQTGENAYRDSIKINDFNLTYSWDFQTTDKKDVEIYSHNYIGGVGPAPEGDEEADEYGNKWYNLMYKPEPSLEKQGSRTINGKKIVEEYGSPIQEFGTIDMNTWAWSSNPNDTLSGSIDALTLDVSYELQRDFKLDYNYFKDAKYIQVTADVAKITECGHDPDHIGNDGNKYYEGWEYCPWPGFGIGLVTADGKYIESYKHFEFVEKNTPTTHCVIPVADIVEEFGENFASGSTLEFYSYYPSTLITEITPHTHLPDLEFKTFSVPEFTIEEANDWDAELGVSVPNGFPQLCYSVDLANSGKMEFAGYSALKIDYTIENPEECSAIEVVFNGWEENAVGWVLNHYAIEGNKGSIIVDLTNFQGRTFNQLLVGPVAQPSLLIGDVCAPEFAVTSAKFIAVCDEAASKPIEMIVSDYEKSFKTTNEVCDKIAESDDTYILSDDELSAIDYMLNYDYNVKKSA
ncbi:MAG: hypothetical protein ACI4YB_03000 [Oscillospiraceae bacterium]